MYTTENREIKARKINAVLEDVLGGEVCDVKILDYGSGSGHIADYFSKVNRVTCADIDDYRVDKSLTHFVKMKGIAIDCPDSSFDIVLSNMTFEHVRDQEGYLREIHRVMKPDALCYFGVPNRIFPIEPHYKIPFIQYLPYRIQPYILKFLKRFMTVRNEIEYVYLPSYFRTKRVLRRYFRVREYTLRILKDPQRYHSEFTSVRFIPEFMLRLMLFFSPTNIYILRKK